MSYGDNDQASIDPRYAQKAAVESPWMKEERLGTLTPPRVNMSNITERLLAANERIAQYANRVESLADGLFGSSCENQAIAKETPSTPCFANILSEVERHLARLGRHIDRF